eukprot:1520074-Alexandrium_andersonii.AAC.1
MPRRTGSAGISRPGPGASAEVEEQPRLLGRARCVESTLEPRASAREPSPSTAASATTGWS